MVVSKKDFKVASVHDISSLKFDCCMVFICLLYALFDGISAGVPEGDSVVNITFSSRCFVSLGFEKKILKTQ